MGISEAQLDDGPLETQVNTFTGPINKLTCSQFDYSLLGLRTDMALYNGKFSALPSISQSIRDS